MTEHAKLVNAVADYMKLHPENVRLGKAGGVVLVEVRS